MYITTTTTYSNIGSRKFGTLLSIDYPTLDIGNHRNRQEYVVTHTITS